MDVPVDVPKTVQRRLRTACMTSAVYSMGLLQVLADLSREAVGPIAISLLALIQQLNRTL